MAKLTEARKAFEQVVRDSRKLQRKIEALFPEARAKSGNNDPAPEVLVGLGQAEIYAEQALAMSDEGLSDMLKRHVGRAVLTKGDGRDG